MDLEKFLSSLEEKVTEEFDQLESFEFIEIVEEPMFSFGELKKFEEKYCMNTLDFYNEYRSGLLPVLKDFEKWAYNFEIFLEADGDIEWLLKIDEEDRYMKGGDKQSPPFPD